MQDRADNLFATSEDRPAQDTKELRMEIGTRLDGADAKREGAAPLSHKGDEEEDMSHEEIPPIYLTKDRWKIITKDAEQYRRLHSFSGAETKKDDSYSLSR